MALLFRRNHNLESLGFLSGEDRDHNSGHRLVSARVLLNLLNLALLMLIFFGTELFQCDLRCIEMTQAECGY